MTREYDKIDKDAFCDKYEKEIDTGSDGKNQILRYEKEINTIFGNRSNFEEYHSRKQQREYLERNPIQLSFDFEEFQDSEKDFSRSKLIEMITSKTLEEIKNGNMRAKLKPLINKLNKEGYFSSVGINIGNITLV